MQLWPKRLTDEQFVERVRVNQRRRKWAGGMCLVTGLIMMGGAAWMYGLLSPHHQNMSEDGLGRMPELARQWDAYIGFYHGVMFGVAVGANWAGGQMLAMWGALEIFGRGLNRRDTLLLQCWDRLHSSDHGASISGDRDASGRGDAGADAPR